MELDVKNIKVTPLLDTLRLQDVSDEEYFSEKYSNYISNSRLNLLKTKGAKAFFEGFKNDGLFNASFDFGDKLHKLVLQPEAYHLIDDIFKPTAKAGVVADYLYKSDGSTPTDDDIKVASITCNYYKDKLTPSRLADFRQKAEPYWRDRYIFEQKDPPSNDEKTRIYTDEKSCGLLKSCLEAIENDKAIQELLYPEGLALEGYNEIECANEKTILLDVQIEIPDYEPKVYRLKAKLDNFSINKEENKLIVNDLKTTSKLARDFNPNYFSYQREIAGYSWLLRMCAKKFFDVDKCKVEGNFLVVSTIPDFNTLVYPMTNEMFVSGWNEYLYLLKSVAYLNIVKGYEFSGT